MGVDWCLCVLPVFRAELPQVVDRHATLAMTTEVRDKVGEAIRVCRVGLAPPIRENACGPRDSRLRENDKRRER